MTTPSPIATALMGNRSTNQQQRADAISDETLIALESILPVHCDRSLETGCGKSTILFSHISQKHIVFAENDLEAVIDFDVRLHDGHPAKDLERVKLVPGPTHQTLPTHKHKAPYDIIMLHGSKGFPFIELEYVYLYPNLKPGGFLIIPDVHVPTIGRFADVVKEDDMFEYHALIETTLVLRRTFAPTYNPGERDWRSQFYNRRRIPLGQQDLQPFRLEDGGKLIPMESIVARRIPFEKISESDRVERRSNGLVDAIMRGYSFRFLGRRWSVSGRNVSKRMAGLVRKATTSRLRQKS